MLEKLQDFRKLFNGKNYTHRIHFHILRHSQVQISGPKQIKHHVTCSRGVNFRFSLQLHEKKT